MIVTKFTRHNAEVIIPLDLQTEIEIALCEIDCQIKKLGASAINKCISSSIHSLGWSGEVRINPNSNMTITSVKSSIGLCIQTGNYGRIYADLLKLQTLYAQKSIDAGIIILPDGAAALIMGQNMANGRRVKRELLVFKETITIPLIIYEFGGTIK